MQLKDLDPSNKAITIFGYSLWHIWKAKNNLIFKADIPTLEDTIHSILRDAEEFQQSMIKSPIPHPCRSSNHIYSTNIQGIPTGFIKLNYDAAVDAQKKRGFVGIVSKDEHMCLKGKFSAAYKFIWDPGILEMLALREAMNWAISKGWKNTIFEGDALQITTIIKSQKCSIASIQGVCADIWHLQNSFDNIVFQSVPRQQNIEAHNWVQQQSEGIRLVPSKTDQGRDHGIVPTLHSTRYNPPS
ncbi:uncharacterized protein LOC130015137 [Mercurialis annua]|uniref:uncharacterized protein LOC126668746 n=1 Tax=Mercurialis annua TaxID=3986 RepID=UPI0024ADB200|nr:uncharacterized protein LOC126668746 [Mercurialis annua]XP_055960696.1 uncharacterized protein LOC130015137 [Mercurialis annua]